MLTQSLNGTWTLRDTTRQHHITAQVPGSNLTALLAADKIPDPLYRDNESRVIPLTRLDWVYSRDFEATEELLSHETILLRCQCLDTLATVRVNGKIIGQADNFHREWNFPLKAALKKGLNRIEITFSSPVRFTEEMDKKHGPLFYWKQQGSVGKYYWLRKPAYHFGWDWGPALPISGILRDIDIVAYSTAKLGDVHTLQHHKKGSCDVEVRITPEGKARGLKASIGISLEGKIIAEKEVSLTSGITATRLTIKNPRLWWPNGLGEQPLYQVTVLLTSADDQPLDLWSRRIGLRTMELRRRKDKWGQSFEFLANGVPFFAKGSNVIPMDVINDRQGPAEYRRLLTDAALCHTNMIRVWGGAYYQPDWFYDICDELGICVWQDMMFGCSTYPTHHKDFMENVRHETIDNVRRLRHHASLALWCGNNELEMGIYGDGKPEKERAWKYYKPLWDVMLPKITAQLDPQTAYWPGSPHTPVGDRNQSWDDKSGDAHLWNVWFAREPFEWYRTCLHRFNSEFGFQCFNEPKTLATFSLPQERNITHPMMEYHQRSQPGNGNIMFHTLNWFRLAESNEMLLWVSQIIQGMVLKYAIEHWRRLMPRGMGTTYWQLNDVWGGATWATIDYLGRWKAGQYISRHFYAPTLISLLEKPEDYSVEVHITSDRREKQRGTWRWRLSLPNGKSIASGQKAVTIPALKSGKVATLPLKPFIEKYGKDKVLLFVELETGGQIVSTNFGTFVRPKQIELEDPKLRVDLKPAGEGKFTARLTAQKPALWAWLEFPTLEVRLSDNFVHLEAGRPVEITLETKATLPQLQKDLHPHSLFDTYQRVSQ